MIWSCYAIWRTFRCRWEVTYFNLWCHSHTLSTFLFLIGTILSLIHFFIDTSWKMWNDVFNCVVQAAYNIGGHIISANAIEQAIFCFRTPRIGRVHIWPSCENMVSYKYMWCYDGISCFIWLSFFFIKQWLESFVSAALRKKNAEQLISSKLCITDFQPLVCFALCTGALSDPVVLFLSLLFSMELHF